MSFIEVVEVSKTIADAFVKNKHYSRRQGFFKLAFGLIEDGRVEGVAVYGIPPLQVCKHSFKNRDFDLLELVRVVVQTKTKNASSLLVGRSLQMLPKPCAVVSYADSEWGHCGIIYQATNWVYTGATVNHDNLYLIDGERIHPRTLAARGITAPAKWAKENNIKTVPPQKKHRYFQFCGSKTDKKKMRASLAYDVIDQYPKCDAQRYDDGERVRVDYYPAWLLPAQ